MLNLITVSHTVTLSLFQTCQRGSTQSRRRTWSWNRRTKSSGSTSRTSCLPPASFRPPTLRANGSEVRVPGRPLGGGTRHRDMERALFSHQTWVPVTRTAHSPQSKLNIQWSKKTKLTFSTRAADSELSEFDVRLTQVCLAAAPSPNRRTRPWTWSGDGTFVPWVSS